MQILVLIFVSIVVGILWIIINIPSYFQDITRESKERELRTAERKNKFGDRKIDSNKTLLERNSDIITHHLNNLKDRSSSRGEWHYLDDSIRDCLIDISEAEGDFAVTPKKFEYLSTWNNRIHDIKYQQLKNSLVSIFKEKYDEIKQRSKNDYEKKTRIMSEKLIEKYDDLIRQFLEITERKVSIIDDYGEESLNSLVKELENFFKKIYERENVDYYGKFRDWYATEVCSSYSENEFSILRKCLIDRFNRYHQQEKNNGGSLDVSINNLSGVEFEGYVAKILRLNNYKNIRGTPKTGDQGCDLLAEQDGHKFAIQVKRYTGNVGNKAVQEVIGAIKFYGCDDGLVITNSFFTPSAKALAQKNNTRLVDGKQLAKMIKAASITKNVKKIQHKLKHELDEEERKVVLNS